MAEIVRINFKGISFISLFFKANELPRTRSLFLPSGSSDNPTPTAPTGARCPGGWVGGWMGGDQKGPLIFSNSSITRAFGAVRVGLSLDPEGRKRLLVRGSSFALKKEQ